MKCVSFSLFVPNRRANYIKTLYRSCTDENLHKLFLIQFFRLSQSKFKIATLYFLIEFNFQTRFRFTENRMLSTASSCIPSAHTCTARPLSTSRTRVVYLLQQMNLYHPTMIMVQCVLFSLAAGQSMDFQCIMAPSTITTVQCMLVHSYCWTVYGFLGV